MLGKPPRALDVPQPLPAANYSVPTSCSARDVVRPEAAEAIAMLRRLGVQPAMLTGDGAAAAGGVGATAGIDVADVHARLLPAEKLEKVGR